MQPHHKTALKILHLTPHTGGGVGTVLRAFISNSQKEGCFHHQILGLESLNSLTLQWAAEQNITCISGGFSKQNQALEMIKHTDIVHIHWWNHPLLHFILANWQLPSFRCVLWSHVNGHYCPQVFFPNILHFPDIFALATPYSTESPQIRSISRAFKTKHLRIIQSSAGIPDFPACRQKKRKDFPIGYIGTVDFCKMHPDFIHLCLAAAIPKAKFIVCGGPHHQILREQANKSGAGSTFDIRGHVENVSTVLQSLEILGYPLNPEHYGTGEQVLIEAMSMGVVPVTLDTGCEKYIIQNQKTGIIARNPQEYSSALRYLYEHPRERKRMSLQARTYTRKNFTISSTVKKWHEIYLTAITFTKKNRRLYLQSLCDGDINGPASLFFNSIMPSQPGDFFLKLLKSENKIKAKNLHHFPKACFANTRGSPFHYYHFFPNDPLLGKLCSKIR